jgi:hypothetical protein
MDVQECFADYRDYASEICGLLNFVPGVSGRVMLAWEEGGLLNPTWSDGKLVRLWMNVIAHQVSTAVLARRIALRLIPQVVITDNIVEAALVHDFYKRREWETVQEAKSAGVDWAEANRAAELASGQVLEALGFEKEVVFLAGSTGDLGLEIMLSGNATVGQKIIFYADSCVSGSKIVGYKKRFDDLLPEFRPGGRYESVDAAYAEKYNGRTHREVWDEVVISIQAELARMVGFSGSPEDLHKIK